MTWRQRLERLAEVRRQEGDLRAYCLQMLCLGAITALGEAKADTIDQYGSRCRMLDEWFGQP